MESYKGARLVAKDKKTHFVTTLCSDRKHSIVMCPIPKDVDMELKQTVPVHRLYQTLNLGCVIHVMKDN